MSHPPTLRRPFATAILCLALARAAFTADIETSPRQKVNAMLDRIAALVEGPDPRPFSAAFRVVAAEGLPREITGATAHLWLHAPDRLRISARWGQDAKNTAGHAFSLCRDRQEIWVHVSDKSFGVIGKAGVARFSTDPASIDPTILPAISLPISAGQAKAILLLAQMEAVGKQDIGGAACEVVRIAPPQALSDALKLGPAVVEIAIRTSDNLPARIRFSNDRAKIEVAVENLAPGAAIDEAQWKLARAQGDRIETVALSHLTRCMDVALSSIEQKLPTLGPARGQKHLVATSGQGRLEMHDGTRVLFLNGTPEEMGRQQGDLLKNETRNLIDRILYGVGVGSSFIKGRWFFGEIESAQARLAPFISERTVREIDAMADAAGVHRQEARLANFFPELFHCSGFAITGEATVGGRMYHGRVLDYLRGVGLEGNAVVMVYRPDQGHAWVNCGYAGFIGSVTAMNEKGISMGEMGGRGEGQWDGKPMAQLIREVMENAGTLDEAIAIMKKGPRTCEYYYVIADGKTRQAVGIAATPAGFDIVRPGQPHERLPHPLKDCVLLSAGDRYTKLVERVKANYGKLDDTSARALMERPVCMTSNIQSVLFAPQTLDFWVANADSKNVASHTRYTKYNLIELLQAPPAKARGLLDGLKDALGR